MGALTAAVARELLWGLRGVSRHVRRWRVRALTIPDQQLRSAAMDSLMHKRANIDGASLFSILPDRRSSALLSLLVAFEIMADFLDNASEGAHGANLADGHQLHLALIESLCPEALTSDYYRHHDTRDDCEYLKRLVQSCRHDCSQLCSFSHTREAALDAARLTQVLPLNHHPDDDQRDASLRHWVQRRVSHRSGLHWFELTGAASAWLTVLALLALAAEPQVDEVDVETTYNAYFPWISLVGTMLDSYVDLADDAAGADHSYIAHYRTLEYGTCRLCELIARAAREARSLRKGPRHHVLVSCMVAMYLTKDCTLIHNRRVARWRLARAGGALALLLMPVLHAWRSAYGQRSH
jgi:tetraprenyl-beta-curcumene synthase